MWKVSPCSSFSQSCAPQPCRIPPPHCHGNDMHQIKPFKRSIQIFPSTSLILLILPALTRALFGNLWALPRRRGKVRAEKCRSHVKHRDYPQGKNTESYYEITAGEKWRGLCWSSAFIDAEKPMSSLSEHTSGTVLSSNFPQRLTLMVLRTSQLLTHFHATQRVGEEQSVSQKIVKRQLALLQLKVLTWSTAACPTASCHGWVPTGDKVM